MSLMEELLSSLVFFHAVEVRRERALEPASLRRHRSATGQNCAERHPVAVERRRVVIILRHLGAVKCDAGEKSLGPRIGQQFGIKLPVGACICVASNRARGSFRARADLELRIQEMLHAALVHCDKHDVGGRTTKLQAPASTRHADRSRCAPATAGAAAGDSLTVLAAETNGALLETGYNRDATRSRDDLVRNAFIRRVGKLLDDGSGLIETLPFLSGLRGVVHLLIALRLCRSVLRLRAYEASHPERQPQRQNFFHFFSPQLIGGNHQPSRRTTARSPTVSSIPVLRVRFAT